jgi:pyridoxine 4-dehydrogenase
LDVNGHRLALGDRAVCRVGLGGGRIPGFADDGSAAALLRRALELGVNLIDTADIYGRGLSETRIAAALHPYPQDLVIATKGGFVPSVAGPVPDGRPQHLRDACEASLRRLRLDRIELYQLHTPDPAVPFEESLGALVELRKQGKVRHLGLSNVTAEQLARARELAPIVSVQNSYNVRRRRRFGPDPVLAACERAGIVFLASQPLAAGRLPGDEAPQRVASRRAATPGQVALSWLLQCSPVVLPIPGTRSVRHLQENVAALSVSLNAEDLSELTNPAETGSG